MPLLKSQIRTQILLPITSNIKLNQYNIDIFLSGIRLQALVSTSLLITAIITGPCTHSVGAL